MRIDVQQRGDEALVTVSGVVDRTVRDATAGLVGLGQDCARVVVDLRDAVLASPLAVQGLVSVLRDRADQIALVCDRLPGRRLLRLACGDAAGIQVLDEVPEPAARMTVTTRAPAPVPAETEAV